jgi:hypothetical protein
MVAGTLGRRAAVAMAAGVCAAGLPAAVLLTLLGA